MMGSSDKVRQDQRDKQQQHPQEQEQQSQQQSQQQPSRPSSSLPSPDSHPVENPPDSTNKNGNSNPQQATGSVVKKDSSGNTIASAAPSPLQQPSMQQGFKIPATKRDARKLFVGGLPSDVTDHEFRTFFEQFGMVLDSVVMFDRETHRSRGFGFVTFLDAEVSKRLLQMGKHADGIGRLVMRGKTCEIKAAEPKASGSSNNAHHHGGHHHHHPNQRPGGGGGQGHSNYHRGGGSGDRRQFHHNSNPKHLGYGNVHTHHPATPAGGTGMFHHQAPPEAMIYPHHPPAHHLPVPPPPPEAMATVASPLMHHHHHHHPYPYVPPAMPGYMAPMYYPGVPPTAPTTAGGAPPVGGTHGNLPSHGVAAPLDYGGTAPNHTPYQADVKQQHSPQSEATAGATEATTGTADPKGSAANNTANNHVPSVTSSSFPSNPMAPVTPTSGMAHMPLPSHGYPSHYPTHHPHHPPYAVMPYASQGMIPHQVVPHMAFGHPSTVMQPAAPGIPMKEDNE